MKKFIVGSILLLGVALYAGNPPIIWGGNNQVKFLQNGAASSRGTCVGIDPSYGFCILETFMSSSNGNTGGTTIANSGSVSVQATSEAANRNGIMELSTSTSTSASPMIHWGLVNQIFGGGNMMFEAEIMFSALSDGTDTYTSAIGYVDANGATQSTDGCYFRYVKATSDNWICECANNTTRTTVTSSTAVAANTWTKLGIRPAADGSNVRFYVNGSEVCLTTGNPISTNIPTTAGTRAFGVGLNIFKSAGTTARILRIDNVFFDKKFTTPH